MNEDRVRKLAERLHGTHNLMDVLKESLPVKRHEGLLFYQYYASQDFPCGITAGIQGFGGDMFLQEDYAEPKTDTPWKINEKFFAGLIDISYQEVQLMCFSNTIMGTITDEYDRRLKKPEGSRGIVSTSPVNLAKKVLFMTAQQASVMLTNFADTGKVDWWTALDIDSIWRSEPDDELLI